MVCMGLRCCGFTGDALPVIAWGRELGCERFSSGLGFLLLLFGFSASGLVPLAQLFDRRARFCLSAAKTSLRFLERLLADRESLRRSMLLGLGFGGLTLRPSASHTHFFAVCVAFQGTALGICDRSIGTQSHLIGARRGFANCSPA